MESILYPYANDRFNMAQGGMAGRMLKRMVGGLYQKVAQQLVQAFVRALYSVHGEIYLNDLASAIISEVGYMMGSRPYTMTGQVSVTGDTFFQWQAEVHRWLIYLMELNELPGKYERFIGKFTRD
ncbi:MAG: hypothetical protein ACTSYI_10720 [Promethearchaeota archaeon]